jgi:hypothetical protein
MTDHTIFMFQETQYLPFCDVETVYDTFIIPVSTRKLEAWSQADENSFAYNYVEHLIKAAKEGSTSMTTGRKYSFGDCLEWYAGLAPDEGCADPIKNVDIEVYL